MTFLNDELYFFEPIDENLFFDQDSHGDFDQKPLKFYICIDGTGEKYWIAEVSIKENLCYYCVATSQTELEKSVREISDKHFPGLLELKNTQIKYFTNNLVYSPVPGFIAENAFKNLTNKKIKDVEIPPSISIPYDVELTPIIDMEKGYIRGLQIKKRNLLAHYEITAIASKTSSVKNARLEEIDDKIIWHVLTNDGEIFINANIGEKRKKLNYWS